MRKLIILLLVFIGIMSCTTTKTIEVPVVNTKIEYRDRLVYDSIYCHDSIYTFVKGDTVATYTEKIVTKYIYIPETILKIDTVSVPVTITKIQEVNRLSKWQQFLIILGAATLLTLVVLVLVKIKR